MVITLNNINNLVYTKGVEAEQVRTMIAAQKCTAWLLAVDLPFLIVSAVRVRVLQSSFVIVDDAQAILKLSPFFPLIPDKCRCVHMKFPSNIIITSSFYPLRETAHRAARVG